MEGCDNRICSIYLISKRFNCEIEDVLEMEERELGDRLKIIKDEINKTEEKIEEWAYEKSCRM